MFLKKYILRNLTYFRKKAFFVHIPKNGGNSVFKTITKVSKNVKLINHDKRSVDFKLLKDYDLKGSNFSFTFVRNPWDRVVSAYLFLKSGGVNRNDSDDFDKYLKRFNSFTDFVMNFDEKILDQIHFSQQYEWVCDDKDNLIVDFVGRFEHLQKDFDEVCQILNLPNIPLLHSNKTKNKPKNHYSSYYNNETKQIIEQKYIKDIEMFEYSYEEI